MATGFIFHELYLWRNTGNAAMLHPSSLTVQPGEQAENPETKRRMKNLQEVSGLTDHLAMLKPRAATEDELARFHTRAHIQKIRVMSAAVGGDASTFTPFDGGSYGIAALAAAGAIVAIEAIEAVLRGTVKNAYTLIWPSCARGCGDGVLPHANTVVVHDETVKGNPDRYWGGFQIDPPETF